MKKILLIDGFNTYIRNFAIVPLQNDDGTHLGGVIGFLNSLRHVLEAVKPDRVLIAWDEGGSTKRKKIYADYKINRVKKARKVLMPFDDLEQQDNSFNHQLTRLKKYLDLLPVNQLTCYGVEADDIIAYVCQNESFDGYEKVIYSTDKDFFQLVNDDRHISIYHPMKKTYITNAVVKEQFQVTPENFPMLRALTGDKSDNIHGIQGVGNKSAIKSFPLLMEEERKFPKDIIEYSKAKVKDAKKPFKAITRVVEDPELIEANYKIIQLIEPDLGLQCYDKFQDWLKDMNHGLKCSKLQLRMLFIQDGAMRLIEYFDSWLLPFKVLQHKMSKDK
jgi:5'-3' exonuclease